MTKAKVLALLIGVAFLFTFLATVLAQQPNVPHVFAGSASLDGAIAADGTVVTAWVDAAQAASATVTGGEYSIKVNPGTKTWADKPVSFQVGGNNAAQTFLFVHGGVDDLNLTAATVQATVTVFADVIANNDNLVRVWRYSNATQSWAFFDPRPAFSAFNTLKWIATNDIVWVNVKVQQTFQGQTLLPDYNLISVKPAPTPTPTSTPTPTHTPSPTLTPAPVAGFLLYLNGLRVPPGQVVVAVPGGTVTLFQLPQSNGTYVPGSAVSMEAAPQVEGSRITWSGVDSYSGTQAIVRMIGERSPRVDFVPPVSALTPTPGPTPTPTPTPPPRSTPTPTPTFTPTPAPTPTHTPLTTTGTIIFVSGRDGNNDIYKMGSNGSNIMRLTTNPGDDRYPTWSRDGSKIAFTSSWAIYMMNADGSGQTRLTFNSPYQDQQPTWSPDGVKIAFVSRRDDNEEIYVVNADGSNQTRLTNNPAEEWEPAWSPDSSKIAFRSRRDGNSEIYAMNTDGTGQTRLTNNPASDIQPKWSPDGSNIDLFVKTPRQPGARWG